MNAPGPPAFRESVRYGEQNLYSQARELVGIVIHATTNSPCSCARWTLTVPAMVSVYLCCLHSAEP